MIILDYQQTAIANLMMGLSNGHHKIEVNESILRHMTLKSIKTIYGTFKPTHGKLIIACDGNMVWRKDYFPYYKANRKKARDESPLDWKMIFDSLHKIRDEIQQFLPYTTIIEPKAEADDIIGALVANRENDMEKVMIVSGDKDFIQLQRYHNVKQWDHVRKRWLTDNDPAAHLKEKLIRGDSGDGVPNFLSPGDSFVASKRQKSITKDNFAYWMANPPEAFLDSDEKRDNWKRNETLMDLSKTPPDVVASIMDKYRAGPRNADMALVREYFIQSGLKELMESIQDFR